MDNLIKRVKGETIQGRKVEWKGWDISKENIKTILEFDNLMVAKGRRPHTRIHFMYTLANMAQVVRIPFKKMKEKDVAKFVAWIEKNKDYGESTKNTYKMCVVKFFKWLYNTKRNRPSVVEFIEHNGKGRKKKVIELLSREEILSMIEAADNLRDKALIATIYESSCRRGEIVSCRVKHLKFNGNYAVLNIPEESVARSGTAKTGSYSAILFDSIPYLKQYLNAYHPHGDDPEAPLFVSMKRRGVPLEVDGVYYALKRTAKRAGIKKSANPHILRHSISTEWAKQGYTKEEINLRSGRKQNSEVGDIYIHLSGRDVQDKVLKREMVKRGLATEEEVSEENPLESIKCWACETPNPPTNTFCYIKDCGAELRGRPSERAKDIQVALKVFRTLKKIGDDPELIRFFEKKLEGSK